jgi:XTP/dITP diphosphohydrolase
MTKPSYREIQTDSLYDSVKFKLTSLKISKKNSKIVIVDDSALFVNALAGFPGVYSSYIYKTIGCEGILKLLGFKKDREAVFKCVIGVSYYGTEKIFEGVCKGRIAYKKRGEGGFGFDPIFVPAGYRKTFAEIAEISLEKKNRISHRGIALRKFVNWFFNQ